MALGRRATSHAPGLRRTVHATPVSFEHLLNPPSVDSAPARSSYDLAPPPTPASAPPLFSAPAQSPPSVTNAELDSVPPALSLVPGPVTAAMAAPAASAASSLRSRVRAVADDGPQAAAVSTEAGTVETGPIAGAEPFQSPLSAFASLSPAPIQEPGKTALQDAPGPVPAPADDRTPDERVILGVPMPNPVGAFAFPTIAKPPAIPTQASSTAALRAPAADDLVAMPAPSLAAHIAPSATVNAVSKAGPTPGEGQPGSDPRIIQALNAVVAALASDLHVTAGAPPMIRVDGGLRPLGDSAVWEMDDLRAALYSLLTDTQREIFERELELDFAYTLSESSRFRVNVYQQREAVGAAFRLIPTEIKQLASLGVPDQIGKFATLARGLVLVTGPTGSGKSTTLAALIDLVNSTRSDHIVTVEDPIEFMHTNKRSLVNQREVGNDTHSFAAALKHVLRQDPDVILIGELRDLETISVALTAAETGHLVFATLHTQDAPQTIDRVIDVFPPHQQGQVRAQLAATLQGVVCQTLVKHASGRGRVVATEVMVTTPAIANLIREGKTYQIHSALQAGRDLGMFTLDQHLAELVDAGRISHTSAFEKAHDIESLKRMIHRADPGADLNNMMSSGQAGAELSSANLGAH